MSDNISFEHDFSQILNGIENMVDDVSKIEAKATLKGAKILKESLEKNVGKSTIDHEHIADDIKISALKTDDEGNEAREVKGGKKTGYKWKWLEFGTSKMKGNQFITKSLHETKDEVQSAIDNELKKVVK